MKVLFLHGRQSVPGGVKPTYLAQHGHSVFNPALPDEDFAAAVRVAQDEYDRHESQVVVGSSRGGAVAMNINSGDARLVLLCPAWKKYGTVKTVKPGEVSDPLPVRAGADAVILIAMPMGAASVPEYEQVKNEMMQKAMFDGLERARKQWLQELRQNVYIDVRL